MSLGSPRCCDAVGFPFVRPELAAARPSSPDRGPTPIGYCPLSPQYAKVRRGMPWQETVRVGSRLRPEA